MRDIYVKLQPTLAPYTPFTALLHHLTVHYLDRIHRAITTVRPDVPLVITLPAETCAEAYGFSHKGRAGTSRTITGWAQCHQIPTVDLYQFTHHREEGALGNPDGMHWGFAVHDDVAATMVETLQQLT